MLKLPTWMKARRLRNQNRAGKPAVLRRFRPAFECLEARTVPTTTFGFLDSFSGATFSNPIVNSGGTADTDMNGDPQTGLIVDHRAVISRINDAGMDGAPGLMVANTNNLRSGGVDIGLADGNQLAQTRNVSLQATNAATLSGFVTLNTGGGNMVVSSDLNNSAIMDLDYLGLSTASQKAVLASNTLTVHYGSDAATDGTTVTLRINGNIVGTGALIGNKPDGTALDFTGLDALVGTQINTIELTFGGTSAADYDLQDIVASFGIADAKISIAPDDVNKVGDPHTFVVTVQKDDGLTPAQGGDAFDGFGPAPNAPTTVTLTDSNGAVSIPSTPLSGTTNALGQFQVTFTSATAGQVAGSAAADVVIPGGDTIHVVTDSTNGSSGPATKRFVDAKISITPDDINKVGDPHTFTVLVQQDDGLTAAQGGDGVTGFTPAVGAPVAVTLTNSNGAVSVPSTPLSGTTSATGQFQVTFNSASAGIVTGDASTIVTISGVAVPRTTDGTHGSTGDATKRYVDAKISITPDDVNKVGDPHTFTVLVQQDDGLTAAQGGDGVTGFAPAPSAPVSVTLTNSNGAVAVPSTPLSGTTDASGQFQVTFTSASAGIVTGDASTIVTVSGVAVPRTTDGTHGSSNDAVKRYVDAKISITPSAVNAVGQNHIFTVLVQQDDGLTAAQGGDGVTGFAPAVGAPVAVTLTNSNGAVAVPSTPLTGTTNASGIFQVTFTSATTGIVTGDASTIVTVSGVAVPRTTDGTHGSSSDAVKRFVDAFITITPGEATNFLNVPHTFTVTVQQNDGLNADQGGDGVTGYAPVGAGVPVHVDLINSNGAVATPPGPANGFTNASGQFQVTFTSATAGTITGHATTNVTIGGVVVHRETDGMETVTGSGAFNSGDAIKHYIPPGGNGATATMGFWHNKNGQAVIQSAPTIGSDLALLYPNLFGTGAGAFNLAGPVKFMNLTGQSAANVALYFGKLFDVTGPHSYAEVMSNVLAGYFDSINNTGTAKKFGFGDNLFTANITITSAQATALGLSSTNVTVGQYLAAVNAKMAGQNGVIPPSLFNIFNDVSDMINNMNDI